MRKEFIITGSMEERWIPYFFGMLERMEHNGNIGHSEMLAFFSDGDGDFHPKFNLDSSLTEKSSSGVKITRRNQITDYREVRIFDAG